MVAPRTETSRRADGWKNRCATCGQFYWIRNADQTAPKCVRWTDDTLTQRHECAPFFTPPVDTSPQRGGAR